MQQEKLFRLIRNEAMGNRTVPSSFAKMLSDSNVFQTMVLSEYMVPKTITVTSRKEFLEKIYSFDGPFVVKEARSSCGIGVYKWDNPDLCYNTVSKILTFTEGLVLQEYVKHFRDVKVIAIGPNIVDAYSRVSVNGANFRNNVAVGCYSEPINLNPAEVELCRNVMLKGHFHYAHMDLFRCFNESFLSEISLSGGLSGSRITIDYLDKLKTEFIESQDSLEWEKQFIKTKGGCHVGI